MCVRSKRFVLSSVVIALTLISIAAPGQHGHIVHSSTSILRLKPTSSKPQQRKLQGPGDPVQLHVTVTGKNDALVNGLQQSNFEVFVDKKLTPIVSFRNQDAPAGIGIVFDLSGSMGGSSKERTQRDFLTLRQAIVRFLNQSNPSNEYFLLGFNTKPQLLADWTSDYKKLLDNFDNLAIEGNSAFYDSCYLAVDKLQASRNPKRVLLLISDGLDNLSRYTFNELRELIRTTGILVYAIYSSGRFYSRSALAEEGKNILSDFSSLSGGLVISQHGDPVEARRMQTVFDLIADDLRHQYTMSILADEQSAGRKWRKIKVAVKSNASGEKTRIRTREGLYSMAQD